MPKPIVPGIDGFRYAPPILRYFGRKGSGIFPAALFFAAQCQVFLHLSNSAPTVYKQAIILIRTDSYSRRIPDLSGLWVFIHPVFFRTAGLHFSDLCQR